jgi:hypothetical protein
MTKIEGSGSISQRRGSADPDPRQDVLDPQHWSCDVRSLASNAASAAGLRGGGGAWAALSRAFPPHREI